jgi:prepilin peptidase dependent protein B
MMQRSPTVQGFTLVEVLVACAISLVVLAAGNAWYLAQVRDHHRAAAAQRLTQALRSAADVITRDVRRSGHWQSAWLGVGTSPTANPYRAVSMQDGIHYAYSRDEGSDNNQINDHGPNERFGFALRAGELRSLVGGAAQTLVDPQVATINSLRWQWLEHEVSLGDHCIGRPQAHGGHSQACCKPSSTDPMLCAPTVRERVWTDNQAPFEADVSASPPPPGTRVDAQCPSLIRRVLQFSLTAQAAAPHRDLQQTWQQQVAVRNDAAGGGVCP